MSKNILGYAVQSATAKLAPFQFQRRVQRKNDVEIEILYCGVCHSDLHQARNDWGNSIYPMVPGHEIVGTVINVGADVKKFKVGDVLTLDRPGTHYQKQIAENNPNKFKAEPVEHSGVIVGFTKQGIPLVKHGGVDEDIVVQPIDKLSLKVNSTGNTLNYTVHGVYRIPDFKINDGYFRQNYKDYSDQLSKVKPLTVDSEDPQKKKFIQALNDNLENQSRNLGLTVEETQQLQKLAYGVFGNETRFGNSKVAPVKELGKRILAGVGLTETSASLVLGFVAQNLVRPAHTRRFHGYNLVGFRVASLGPASVE